MGRMTTRRLDSLKTPGRHRCDQTLYLVVEPGGSKHWIQRLVVAGKRRDLGLGSYPLTSLSEARERAWENRKLARQGGDPMPSAVRVPTFGHAAGKVEASNVQWSAHTVAVRRAALDSYAGALMNLPVNAITRENVLSILMPVYEQKPPTARSLRGWIRSIFSWAQAHGYVEHNAAGEMIDGALPKKARAKEPRKALPYADVGAALARVDAGTAGETTKACLRFAALTAVRSNEARGATWNEIDLDAREWRIPAARMKMDTEHRVPLSAASAAILEAMRACSDSGLVFPSARGRPLSRSTLIKALQAATGTDVSVHGFRTSFRTWAAEKSSATRDVAEMCLAHKVGSEIERSYARSDLFEKRRTLMESWAAYVSGDTGKVLRYAAS